MEKITKCVLCNKQIFYDYTGEPYIIFKRKNICSDCSWDLIPLIHGLSYGGFVDFVFKDILQSSKNRKHRRTIRDYRKTFNMLLLKYNFECANCGATEGLTIDHIKPVKLGGTDDYSNLQILCKSCNSRKGAKYEN
jgi:uncharacterized protein CbrC (UPF0167 family)